MKTLIFSDTHLTAKFDPATFEFLKSIIAQADKIIINGDFWDSYFISFQQFLESEWQQLFSLLKAKKAVYIYGNHDPKTKLTEGYDKFTVEVSDKFEFKSGERSFYVEHGDQLSKPIQDRLHWLPVPMFVKTIHNFYDFLSAKIFHNRTPENYLKARSLFLKARKGKDKDLAIILGHSHLPVCDDKNNNYSTGFIGFGYGSYLLIENGKVTLKESAY